MCNQNKLLNSIPNQLKLTSETHGLSHELNQVNNRKIDACKIENQLNIKVFIWDSDKPKNIKLKQIMFSNKK